MNMTYKELQEKIDLHRDRARGTCAPDCWCWSAQAVLHSQEANERDRGMRDDKCKLNPVPKPQNVIEIVQLYIIQNGYDGLYNVDAGCGCLCTDLSPCWHEWAGCKPGYKKEYTKVDQCGCEGQGEDHWHIQKDKA